MNILTKSTDKKMYDDKDLQATLVLSNLVNNFNVTSASDRIKIINTANQKISIYSTNKYQNLYTINNKPTIEN
jgi:hypothetical protein